MALATKSEPQTNELFILDTVTPARVAASPRQYVPGVAIVVQPREIVAAQSLERGHLTRIVRYPLTKLPETAAELWQEVSTLMVRERLPRRDVRFALPSYWCEHMLQSLPPASTADLRNLVERELRKRPSLADEPVWCAIEVPDPAGKRDVLAAASPGARVRELMRLADKDRVQITLLTTPALGLLERFAVLANEMKNEALGLLSIEEPFATLTLFDQGRPAQLRSVACDLKSAAALGELNAEIKRSALFFKQRAQGRTLGRLYISGLNQDRAELLAQSLHEQLEVPCEPLPMHVPFLEEENIPPELPILQAMLYDQRESAGWLLDLTPAERRSRSPLATIVMAAVIVFALVSIALGRMVLARTLAQTAKHHRMLESEITGARTRAAASLKLQGLLGDAVALQQQLNDLAKGDLGLASVMGNVLKDIPSAIALTELTVDQGGAWIEGEPPAGRAEDAPLDESASASNASLAALAEVTGNDGARAGFEITLRGRVFGESWEAERSLSRLRAGLNRFGKADVQTYADEVADGEVTATDRSLMGRPFRIVARIEVKR